MAKRTSQDAETMPISPAERHAGEGGTVHDDVHDIQEDEDIDWTAVLSARDEAEEVNDEPAGFTDDILERAHGHGISLGDARSFDSPAALERFLGNLDMRPSAPAPGRQESKPAEKPTAKYNLVIPDELVEPEVRDQFQKMSDHYGGIIDDLLEKVGAMGTSLDTHTKTSRETSVMRVLEGMGPEYAAIAKNGGVSSIVRQMQVIEAGRKALGEKPLSQQELCVGAISGALGDKHQTAARQTVAKKVTKRRGQAIRRPTKSRETKEKTGEQKAVQSVAEYMHEHNMLVEPEETFE